MGRTGRDTASTRLLQQPTEMGGAILQQILLSSFVLLFHPKLDLLANASSAADGGDWYPSPWSSSRQGSHFRRALGRDRRFTPEHTCLRISPDSGDQVAQGCQPCCSKAQLEADYSSRYATYRDLCPAHCYITMAVLEPVTNSSRPMGLTHHYVLRRRGDRDSRRPNVVLEAAIYLSTSLSEPTSMLLKVQFGQKICRRKKKNCAQMNHMVGAGCTVLSIREAFRGYYSGIFLSEEDVELTVRMKCPRRSCLPTQPPLLRVTLMAQNGACTYTNPWADPPCDVSGESFGGF